MKDALGREILPNGAKAQIADALARIPTDKRGALILFATHEGATATLAAKLWTGERWEWKVAGGGGVHVNEKPSAWVSVEGFF